MPTSEPDPPDQVTARGYEITVDDGRDSFYALSIEEANSDTAWVMSDTVCDLENVR